MATLLKTKARPVPSFWTWFLEKVAKAQWLSATVKVRKRDATVMELIKKIGLYCNLLYFIAVFEGGADLRLRPAAAFAHLRRAMLQRSDKPRGRGGSLPRGEIRALELVGVGRFAFGVCRVVSLHSSCATLLIRYGGSPL